MTKKPKRKKTAAQIVPDAEPDDQGSVRLRVNPQYAGPAPRIHYVQEGEVTPLSPILIDQPLVTNALRVQVLVIDPSNQFETGEPVTWENRLVIRNRLEEAGNRRRLNLFVAPQGQIRYTLNGSEPRDGVPYDGPFDIDDGDVLVRVFAETDGLTAKADFKFSGKGPGPAPIDQDKPARLQKPRGGIRLDSRGRTFIALKEAGERGISFERVSLTVGQGSQSVTVVTGDIQVAAEFIQSILNTILGQFDANTPISMTFAKAHFASGHDLMRFAEAVGIKILPDEVEQ